MFSNTEIIKKIQQSGKHEVKTNKRTLKEKILTVNNNKGTLKCAECGQKTDQMFVGNQIYCSNCFKSNSN